MAAFTVALAVLLVAAPGPRSIGAATLTVSNNSDSGASSLRGQINAASDGDTIDMTGLSGTILLTSGELYVDKSVTIDGPGANLLAVDGNAAGRVFHIAAGKTVVLSGLTITNGFNVQFGEPLTFGGGILSGDGGGGANLTVTGCTVSNNFSDLGGGIVNWASTLHVENSTISGNGAAGIGGGILNYGIDKASAFIRNCTISGNTASSGSGILNLGIYDRETFLSLSNSTLHSTVTITSGDEGGLILNAGVSGTGAELVIGSVILNTPPSSQTTSYEPNIVNADGFLFSDGYNLSSDDESSLLNAAGDQNNTNPLLGPLADNGGHTLTHALPCGSPAIDAGYNFAAASTDQRGGASVRKFDDPALPNAAGGDGTDIGAFELQASCCDADAGPDQLDVCGRTAAFAANVPPQGFTGTWSFASGSGSFSDKHDPAATVSDLAIGTNVLVWTVSNGTSSCQDDLTITTETALPSVACNGDISVNTDAGLCSATVDLTGHATASDNCPGVVVSYDMASPFPKGTTLVTATATDSSGNSRTCTFNVIVTEGTATTVSAASTTYSDMVDLSASVAGAGGCGTTPAGTLNFKVNGVAVGSAAVGGLGIATLTVASQAVSDTDGTYPDLAQGPYTIHADFVTSDATNYANSSGENTLTVSREDAAVMPSSSNLCSAKVNLPGGSAGPVTLCADIAENEDNHLGHIEDAVPVTVALVPVVGGGTVGPLVATTSGSGIGGTLHACATFSTIPVNVYTVVFSVGGNSYAGAGESVLSISDPSLGFVSGGGKIVNPNTLNPANFGFIAKYQKNGGIQGSALYIEHLPGGSVSTLKAGSLKSLSIVGNTAVVFSKNAVFNGVGKYGAQMTAVDGGDPGTSDQFGLKLTNPNGSNNAAETFGPQTLVGGNISVPHK
jgi:hypothetical protein